MLKNYSGRPVRNNVTVTAMNKNKIVKCKTIHDLRKEGHKVKVHHYRMYQVLTIKTFNVKNEIFPKDTFKPTKQEYSQLNGTPMVVRNNGTQLVNPCPCPRGGATVVDITFADGTQVRGESYCQPEDNFCYKDGVDYALLNAQRLLDTV